MKIEIANLWADELESGRWVQTTDRLKREGPSYCCLGVLCELARQAGVRLAEEFIDGEDEGADFLQIEGESEILPLKVRRWAGIDSSEGRFGRDEEGQNLARLNDSGSNFSALAQTIREHATEL